MTFPCIEKHANEDFCSGECNYGRSWGIWNPNYVPSLLPWRLPQMTYCGTGRMHYASWGSISYHELFEWINCQKRDKMVIIDERPRKRWNAVVNQGQWHTVTPCHKNCLKRVKWQKSWRLEHCNSAEKHNVPLAWRFNPLHAWKHKAHPRVHRGHGTGLTSFQACKLTQAWAVNLIRFEWAPDRTERERATLSRIISQ